METHNRAVIKGKRNHYAGDRWEQLISRACEYYSEQGEAEVMKTPEPMRPTQSLGNGKFIAYFTKMAQPDFKGVLKGGQAVVFEAKHTEKDRMLQSVISSEQAKELDKCLSLGAECFVLVSFELRKYYKIPWAVFRDMKNHFGRKYIKPDDLKEYEIHRYGGVLRFLG